MDDGISVGSRLRRLRRERNLSQKELAELCGLSLNAVSLTERDEISPNVATLQRLAAALNVRMGCFFEPECEDGRYPSVIYVKAGQCHTVTAGGVTIEGICNGKHLEGQQMQPFLLTLAPHSDIGTTHVEYGGHEFICCIKGILRFEVAEAAYVLEAGDMLMFEAGLPHFCRNVGEEEARFLMVVQTPEVPQDSPRWNLPGFPALATVR